MSDRMTPIDRAAKLYVERVYGEQLKRYLKENPMMLTKAEIELLLLNLTACVISPNVPISHILSDFLDYTIGIDSYKEFAAMIEKRISLRKLRILDIAAGIHIRTSIALKKKGAKVTAMDCEARSRHGVPVIDKNFTGKECLDDYDLITALRAPKECTKSILEAATKQGKKYLIIPSGNAFEDTELQKLAQKFEGAKVETWICGAHNFEVVTNL